MKDRIKQLMERQHMSQQTFADILEISPASLSGIFNDRTKPTLNHVEAIKRKFPTINLEWLLYGNGPIFLDEKNEKNEEELSHSSLAEGSILDFGVETTSSSNNNAGAFSNSSTNINRGQSTKTEIKYIEKPQRKITEIRIFFDDQTWETFVPQK